MILELSDRSFRGGFLVLSSRHDTIRRTTTIFCKGIKKMKNNENGRSMVEMLGVQLFFVKELKK